MTRKPAILIVDDDGNDQFLIQMALKQIGIEEGIYAVRDGSEAIAFLRGEGPYADRDAFQYPTLMLLDLKMPKVNGFELLRYLQDNRHLSIIPTIVLTSSTDPNDITNAYLLGASSYQVKAHSMDGLRDQIKSIYDYWMRCEVPEVDRSGHLLPTEGAGKLSEKALAITN